MSSIADWRPEGGRLTTEDPPSPKAMAWQAECRRPPFARGYGAASRINRIIWINYIFLSFQTKLRNLHSPFHPP